MEHDKLLRKMEILSRKISKLKDVSTMVKALPSTSMYSKSRKSIAWHGNGQLHNQPTSGVLSELPGFSKYRYTKKTSDLVSSNSSLGNRNVSSLSVPFASKPSLPVPPNVYVNPHFKARGNPTLLETRKKPDYINSFECAPAPANMPNKTVYVNPTLFNPKKPLQPSNTQPANKVADENLKQDKKHVIHVNRTMLSTKTVPDIHKSDNAKTSIHVNPQVYARLKSEVKKEAPGVRRITTPVNKFQRTPESSPSKSLISISRMKLVRGRRLSQLKTPPSQYSIVPKMRPLSASKAGSSPTIKVAKNVCSKYKFIRKSSANNSPSHFTTRKMSPFVKTKYKLDRRLHRSPKPFKNVQKYSLKYEKSKNKSFESNLQGILQRKRYSPLTKSPYGNRVWGNVGSLQPKRVIITNRKLLRIGNSPVVKRNFTPVQSSTLLRIGGILYKTSRTKLTRTSSATKPKSSPKPGVFNKTTVEEKSRSGHIVHVRGNKFLMDSHGKTLKRVESNNQMSPGTMKRVDIGGATFIQSTPNVLIRTNTHNTRSLLSQAKQRSIASLATQRRKNNTICKFYRRFGKCNQHKKGRCPCVHDKKYIAICKGFLKGKCEKDVCLLSHDLIPEKMPTCKYYLQVCCARDNCPYLHIKLKAQAPLCIGFLQGYCSDGLACRKWHFNICPQFDKAGSCPKGKYCPFPHTARYKEVNLDHMKMDVDRIKGMYADYYNKLEVKPKQEAAFRYFLKSPEYMESNTAGVQEDKSPSGEEEQLKSETKQLSVIDNNSNGSNNGDQESCSNLKESRLMRRPKIGYLPSYIPLCKD